MSDTTPPVPPFSALSTDDGALCVSWAPFPGGARAALIVALREIGEDLTEAFWAGDLDNDLIRQPVDASLGTATVHVPMGRLVHVALIVRGPGGEVLTALPVRTASPPTPGEHTLEAPVSHDAEPSHETPLVFADGLPPASFQALAKSVASRASGAEPDATSGEVVSGFGARQRWTLTRLQWSDVEGGPLALVVRDSFIDERALADWSSEPPTDAAHLDATCDSLIDAETPQDALRFYAVLRGPSPWRPLALSPVPPPFDTITHPHVLGDPSTRLADGVAGLLERLETERLVLSDLEPQLLLLRGAVAILSAEDPLRGLVDQAATRWRAGERT